MSWIQTYTGKKFDVLNPRAEDVCWLDIAHSLSQQCRFNGHTKLFYSVAEHCVLASLHVPERFALHALLHDAAEAYIGDMPKPVKDLFPEFSRLEGKILEAVFVAAGLEPGFPYEAAQWINGIDVRLLMTERDQLMSKPPEPWGLDHPDLRPEPVPVTISCWLPQCAEDSYLYRLAELGVEVQMPEVGGQESEVGHEKHEKTHEGLKCLPGAILKREQFTGDTYLEVAP